MRTIHHTNLKIDCIGLSIMLLTVIFRALNRKTGLSLNILCPYLYLLFFILWMISLNRRIIQKSPKRMLLMVAGCELLWDVIRTLKYEFFRSELTVRYGWYFYYLPMLMLAALCLLLAISMRKPEHYKPSKKLLLFPAFSVLLFLLVLTNDLHRAVFIIPPGIDGMEVGNYHYGWGYFLIVGYIASCVIACYGIILVKCRIRNRRILHFLPLIPLFAGTAVCIYYVMGHAVFFGFYHLDITIFMCFLTTATLEMCIQSGLIMSNAGYRELFLAGSLRAVITDEAFSPLIASNDYRALSKADMLAAQNAPVMLKNGLRLSSASLSDGHVLWQDDLSELQQTLQELSEKMDYIQGKNAVILQANSFRKREQQLIEKNRLYNQILTHTRKEIETYANLVERMSEESDPEKSKILAIKLAFVGAYIKRHDNLIFLNEMDDSIAPAELSYCIEESLSNLRLNHVNCFCSYSLTKPIPFEKISRMYEDFYNILFARIDSLSSVCAYLVEEEDGEDLAAMIIVRILCMPECDLRDLEKENIQVEKEENEWVVIINRKMYELMYLVSGQDIQSLSDFDEVLSRQLFISPEDETVWQFQKKNIEKNNAYTEIIASDITELYRKKCELENRTKEQQELMDRLEEIGKNVISITRNEEILALKMRVHSELGIALAETRQFINSDFDPDKKAKYIADHRKVAQKLLGEIEQDDEIDIFSELVINAEKLGAQILLQGTLPKSVEGLMTQAARECLINTIRHGNGDKVFISATEENQTFTAVITDNGTPPTAKITEGGGLTSLRKSIEANNGTMSLKYQPELTITITLPLQALEESI